MVFPNSQKRHADTIFTLAAGYLLIWIVETVAKNCGVDKYLPAAHHRSENEERPRLHLPGPADHEAVRMILALIPCAAATYGICRTVKWFGCDYSYGGVICILILYLFYRVREISLLAAWAWLTYYNENELLAVTGFWLIWCYNGKRGKQHKYFFYLFYPGHLILLYLIRKAIFGN